MAEGPVIIVGGGLNGLTMAVLLADLDVPTVLVERHTDTSIQYKFAGLSPRSMEIFRGAGLEDYLDLSNTITAMPVVAAIPAVHAAPPGIRTYADLPLITGRWARAR